MIEIETKIVKNCEISVPGSKSYTHRFLVASALSDGVCFIDNALKSEDTIITINALRQMGVRIEEDDNRYIVHGGNGKFKQTAESVYVGNSGTSMRFMTALASLGQGR
ncbi:MAG: 3-phosphoshikimate 1-carboxyvinyltransferase, partial [Deltaproteobacteria bacterium]|nr:3-phosphoshikimate 1-carboxyvinyltransferase [Deltaproteobacteria bacterium]